VEWNFVFNLATALGLGCLIGLERQWRHHPAGLRTNTLVTLGAAMFVSMTALMDEHDGKTRIVSYVVSGLGFLGGGVILRDGVNVMGLSTAATIWCCGAIGALAGAGFRMQALFCTGVVLLVHLALRPVALWLEERNRKATDVETYYRLRVTCNHPSEALVRSIMMRHIGGHPKMTVQGISTEEIENKRVVIAEIYAAERSNRFMEDLVARLSIEPDVKGVSWSRVQP
jgi:putative Mg2+ transporter-C (MgtC) family protein